MTQSNLVLREGIRQYLRERALTIYKIDIDFKSYKCQIDINFDALQTYLRKHNINFSDYDLMLELISLTTGVDLPRFDNE